MRLFHQSAPAIAAPTAFFLVMAAIQPSRADDSLPNGVAAGDVTQTSAVLWAHTTALGSLQFEWTLDPEFNTVLGTAYVNVTDALLPAKLEISASDGLSPGQQLYYRATDAAGAEAYGQFRTPAALGVRAGMRLGVSGDWRGELSPYPSVRNVSQRDLDLWISLGDTIYADFPSPAVDKDQCETLDDFRLKHNEVYSVRYKLNTLRDVRQSTAILAMIDDHEVTNDFAGGAPPTDDPRFSSFLGDFINQTDLFQSGLQAFTEYNPIRDERWTGTNDARLDGQRNLYRYRTFGSDAAVFLTDARSFRDAELPPAENPLDPASIHDYLTASFDPSRTLLGRPQIEQLKLDLLSAQNAGITWKFVLVGEPIQHLGVIFASDRYEGYAAERTELLRFVADHELTNVVFVAADIHGTLINNLTYQEGPDGGNIPVSAWEISTGSVAFDAPFARTIFDFAARLGFVPSLISGIYGVLPISGQDAVGFALANLLLDFYGYDRLGLDRSGLPVRRERGGWLAVNSFGWTEFDVDRDSQRLQVTTYAIKPYTAQQLQKHPKDVTQRKPYVISRFTVDPQ